MSGGNGAFNETYVDGQGGTGNLPGIPLNTHTFSNTASGAGFAHSRSSEWDFSAKQSRIFLDARTPSPYGEVKAYLEFDFSASNTNTILNNNQGSVNGYIPRFREGYATFGGLLMGQTTGTFVDNDSSPTLVDGGGQTGTNFVARTPQVRYTYPLGNGWAAAVAPPIRGSPSSRSILRPSAPRRSSSTVPGTAPLIGASSAASTLMRSPAIST